MFNYFKTRKLKINYFKTRKLKSDIKSIMKRINRYSSKQPNYFQKNTNEEELFQSLKQNINAIQDKGERQIIENILLGKAPLQNNNNKIEERIKVLKITMLFARVLIIESEYKYGKINKEIYNSLKKDAENNIKNYIQQNTDSFELLLNNANENKGNIECQKEKAKIDFVRKKEEISENYCKESTLSNHIVKALFCIENETFNKLFIEFYKKADEDQKKKIFTNDFFSFQSTPSLTYIIKNNRNELLGLATGKDLITFAASDSNPEKNKQRLNNALNNFASLQEAIDRQQESSIKYNEGRVQVTPLHTAISNVLVLKNNLNNNKNLSSELNDSKKTLKIVLEKMNEYIKGLLEKQNNNYNDLKQILFMVDAPLTTKEPEIEEVKEGTDVTKLILSTAKKKENKNFYEALNDVKEIFNTDKESEKQLSTFSENLANMKRKKETMEKDLNYKIHYTKVEEKDGKIHVSVTVQNRTIDKNSREKIEGTIVIEKDEKLFEEIKESKQFAILNQREKKEAGAQTDPENQKVLSFREKIKSNEDFFKKMSFEGKASQMLIEHYKNACTKTQNQKTI
ncbi:MAG TPA: hypothetical protein VLL98_05125 [Rickettsiales bacterium]|nr:hypothetical protein [Rickettsiales bacterium]